MVGKLVVTFYERGSVGATEIWAYPDDTLNLVVATEGREQAIPCLACQLQEVLLGKPLHLKLDDAAIRLIHEGDLVCVHVTDRDGEWKQCIDARIYAEAMEALPGGMGYAA